MVVGNFNYHQILFFLDAQKTKEEKLGYLFQIKRDMQRVVKCFESSKMLPLRMYAEDNIIIDGNSPELKNFIRQQIAKYTSDPHEKRFPGDGVLRGLLRKEITEYKKFSLLIDSEIEEVQNKSEQKPKYDYTDEVEKFQSAETKLVDLIQSKNSKIVWKNSIGELVELVNSILSDGLIQNSDKNNLSDLICSSFVDSEGNEFEKDNINKVHQMLINSLWQNSSEAIEKDLNDKVS